MQTLRNAPQQSSSSDGTISAAVGVIGIGVMGMPMARRLLASGFRVVVRDVRSAAGDEAAALGLTVVASAAALAAQVGLTLIMVVDAAQIEAVLFGETGLVAGINKAETAGTGRSTVMLCSTIAPADSAGFAQRLAAHGVAMLDAPVSGGPVRALQGTLSMMLAAAPDVLARAAPVLAALADRRFVISTAAGDAAKVKLVNNLLAGTNLVAAAEAMALGRQLGLDGRALFDVINQSSGASWIFTDRMARVLAEDFAPRAALTLLAKDLTLATALAQSVGQPTPLGVAALAVFHRAIDAIGGEFDDAAVIAAYAAGPAANIR